MRGILWHVTRKLEGIFDGILMEFHMRRISEDKNQIQKLMYILQYLSSGLYGRYSNTQSTITKPTTTTNTHKRYCCRHYCRSGHNTEYTVVATNSRSTRVLPIRRSGHKQYTCHP